MCACPLEAGTARVTVRVESTVQNAECIFGLRQQVLHHVVVDINHLRQQKVRSENQPNLAEL